MQEDTIYLFILKVQKYNRFMLKIDLNKQQHNSLDNSDICE